MGTVTKARGVALLLVVVAVTVVQTTLFGATDSDYFESEEDEEVISVNVSSLEPTELLVSWTFEDNATSYFEVTWSPANQTEESSDTTNDTSYTITDLTPCTSYIIYVLAMDADDMTLASSTNQTATTARSESNVSSLAVDAVVQQPSQLDVSWLAEEDPGNCSRNFSVTWFSLSDVEVREASTAATEYTIEDLEAFTSYNVCVTTCLSDAFDIYPMCDVNQTVEDSPGPPVNVSAWTEGEEELRVSWGKPDEPRGIVIGYTVFFAALGTEPSSLKVNGSTTTAIISKLLPCTTYNVTVSASTSAGEGEKSNSVFAATEAAAPASPSNVSVDQLDGQPGALAVSWVQADTRGNCSVTNNTVQWRLADGGDIIDNRTMPATVEANITDLLYSTVYCVGVAAAVYDMPGPFGECVNGTTGRHASEPPSNTSWIVAVSVAAVVLLVAAGVGIYVFRDKLTQLKPRLRASSSFGSRPRHGPSTSPFPQVSVAAGEVQTTDLRKYIKRLEEDTQRGLEEEFELVRQLSAQHPALAAAEYFNKPKNRFRNILAFDHSRVTLPLLAGDSSSNYINANYVTDARGKQLFVACQGPTGSTVGDFWRLVWHVGATVVVMLTNLRERGRERCALYWPTPEEPSITGGDVTVSSGGEAGSEDLRVREFVLQKGKEARRVRQYHHTTWPDFGVPNHEYNLLDLLSEVRGATTPRDGCPVVVHCSAGVGRTGTFIGLWNLMDMMDAAVQPASINVQETVLTMRECRPNMVQTPEQYLYLYKCIAVYLEQPTKWRRKAVLGLPGVPAAEASQDYIFAFNNPTFSEEGLDGGS